MPKKKSNQGKPEVNKKLKGLDIKINKLGAIDLNYDIDELNKFLNENVDDKKLREKELPPLDISNDEDHTTDDNSWLEEE